MLETHNITRGIAKARDEFPSIVRGIEQREDWQIVERRDGFRVLVAGYLEMFEALRECRRFSPQVNKNASGGFSITLPELAVHGEGESLDEAADDLVDAALEYAEDWHSFLSQAPNHARRRWWVFLVEAAALQNGPDGVRRLILGE